MRINKALMSSAALNVITVVIYSVVLQLIVLPFMAQVVPQKSFGELLTLFAIANVVGMVLGAAISNLILRDNIHKESIDFSLYNQLFLLFSVLVFPVLCIVLTFYSAVNFFPVILITYCLAIRTYLSVEFRLQLNYVVIFWIRMAVVLGYLLGIYLFQQGLISNGLNVLLLGELLAMLLLLRLSTISRTGTLVTKVEISEMSRYLGLCVSQGSQNITTYGDRLILSKVIDFSAVPVFYAAGLTGRLAQMCAETMSGVLLSYISKYKLKITSRYVVISGLMATVVCFFSWYVMQFVSPLLIQLLYVNFYAESLPILPWVNAIFAIKIAEILYRPIFITLVPIKIIVGFDSFIVVIFLLVGVVAAILFGLKGFAAGLAMISLVKFLGLFFLMLYYSRLKAT